MALTMPRLSVLSAPIMTKPAEPAWKRPRIGIGSKLAIHHPRHSFRLPFSLFYLCPDSFLHLALDRLPLEEQRRLPYIDWTDRLVPTASP